MAGGAAGGAIEDGHALCGSAESRTENSAEGGETKRLDLGGDVAACRRESRHAPRPKHCVSLPSALFSVRLSVEPQRVCPSSMAPPVAAPAIASVPPDIAESSPGVRPVNTQGPCSGPCCAGGPGPRHSGTEVCLSPGCSQSRTAPPVPVSSCPTSLGPDTTVSLVA